MAAEKEIKLLVITPNPEDGTSFYRGWGPLISLSKQYPHIKLIKSGPAPSWVDLKAADVIFIQRPDVPIFLKPLKEALDLGKPVWVDYDDLLTQIPFSNPTHVHYWQESIQDTIKTVLRCVTAITLSTKNLGTFMCPDRKDAVIIPNAWDDNLYPLHNVPREKEKILISWRGSNTHDEDLLSVLGSINKFSNEFKDKVEFSLFGNPSWQFLDAINKDVKVEINPWNGLLEFNKIYYDTNPNIVIAPLQNHEFNYAKSNCAWLEATRAGAVVLAPNFSEWKRPGVTNYRGEEEFSSKLAELVNLSHHERGNLWRKSCDYIVNNLSLKQTNEQRLDLLRKLTKSQ